MRYWISPILAGCLILLLIGRSDIEAGDAIKVLHLDKLNTEADEEDPFPGPDGTSLFYASNALGSYDIYVSIRPKGSLVFPKGKPVINDKMTDERSPFVYKDKLYFASNEVKDPQFAKMKNYDLLTRSGTLAPLYVPGDVNSAADELYPWVTPAGKEFYFSRKTAEGWTLFAAKGPTPGPIGDAKPVGFPPGFHRATVAGTGLVMYLQGPLDGGKIGIFRSKRTAVGKEWSRPEPVKALNHPESKKGDMQPALSADGTRLYFTSDRPGGKGGLDIWVVLTSQLK
jgi:Tol biopolymer transport system component